MELISKDMVGNTLDAYRSGFRYLKGAAIDYPNVWARFVVEERELVEDVDHTMAAEIVRCLTEFCYVYFGHIISEGGNKLFGDLSFEEYRKVMADNLVIREFERFKFREKLKKNVFFGKFELRNPREHESAYIQGFDCRVYAEDFDFFFYDRKCFGQANFMFYLERPQTDQHVL